MKTFYSVTMSLFDNGKVIISMSSQKCPAKPENIMESKRTADVYIDWFDTQKEAKAFIESNR